jgi:serine/threonine protein kinase
LAPERLQGSGRVNAKADVYGVGCLYYYMLHGHAPFEADSIDSVIHRLQSAEFEIRQDVDEMTEEFLKQTIESNVNKRLSHMSSHPLFEKVDWNKIKKKESQIMKLEEISLTHFCDHVGDYDYTEENFPNKKINDWFYGGAKEN